MLVNQATAEQVADLCSHLRSCEACGEHLCPAAAELYLDLPYPVRRWLSVDVRGHQADVARAEAGKR